MKNGFNRRTNRSGKMFFAAKTWKNILPVEHGKIVQNEKKKFQVFLNSFSFSVDRPNEWKFCSGCLNRWQKNKKKLNKKLCVRVGFFLFTKKNICYLRPDVCVSSFHKVPFREKKKKKKWNICQ